jgi:HEPN domain-containing protein
MARSDYDGVSEQAKASRHRLDDARALFNSVRWRGSMYIAGYSVECLLKTKLMRMFGCFNLRDLEAELRTRGVMAAHDTIFTHQLEVLLRLTNGVDRLRQDLTLWRAFNLANRWVPAWRYSPERSEREEAEAFLEAVERVLKWIEFNL